MIEETKKIRNNIFRVNFILNVLGWTGQQCDRPCNEQFYGNNCTQSCQCKNNAACEPQNGILHCDTIIFLNFLFRQTRKLFIILGTCICGPGYYGEYCNERCPFGKFGRNCAQDCDCDKTGTVACNAETGECMCKHSWNGKLKRSILLIS